MTVKLLYLPDENDENDPTQLQIGPRKAFERLEREGLISEFVCFSFLSKFRKGRNLNAVKSELLDIVENMHPDIVFWQHVSEFPVDQEFIELLKKKSHCRLLVYHDLDAFDSRVKRVSSAMRTLMRNSDLTFLSGLEPMSALMRRCGANEVRYLPTSYDNIRSGRPWVPSESRPYRAVMIANSGKRRIPGFYLPGGRHRAQLAAKLSRGYGAAFALYGRGWEALESARGPLPYYEQESAIRRSWISVNWDHYEDVAYYYSDRLPISLAAGVVHVTTYHPGYEFIFKDCPGLYPVRSVDEAMSCVSWLLSLPKEVLIEQGLAAKAWVEAHLEADIVYRRAIKMCLEKIADLSAKPIT